MYGVLTPSKTVGSPQPARCTNNLQPYLLGSFQADRQTDSLYFSTMILEAMQLMGQYVHTLQVSWSVDIGQNSAFQWERGEGERVFCQIQHSSYSTHQIPSTTMNCLFYQQHFLSKDILLLQNLSASKNSLEEQIFSGTDPLGALVIYTPLFPFLFRVFLTMK